MMPRAWDDETKEWVQVPSLLSIAQTLDDLTTTLEAIVPAVGRLNARLEALEARMEHVVTVETSEERLRRVYGERY